MKALLAIEWLKLKRYRTFWVLIGIFAVLLPLWNYFISAGIMKFGAGDINIFSQAYSFPSVWGNVGFWASIFVVFISILVIIITTNEYQYKTNRQNVIDGLSRLQFYHSKWYVVLVLSLFTALYALILGTIFGVSNGGNFSGYTGEMENIFYIFVLSLNYYSFSLLLSLFFKRSGMAIGMFLLYSLILEFILSGILNWSFGHSAGNFLPLQCSDTLLPFPIMEMLKKMTHVPNGLPNWGYVLASFGWIIIYYFTGRRKLLRSDW